jgi:hypothetical protein
MAEETQPDVPVDHDLAPALDISRRPGEGRREGVACTSSGGSK